MIIWASHLVHFLWQTMAAKVWSYLKQCKIKTTNEMLWLYQSHGRIDLFTLVAHILMVVVLRGWWLSITALQTECTFWLHKQLLTIFFKDAGNFVLYSSKQSRGGHLHPLVCLTLGLIHLHYIHMLNRPLLLWEAANSVIRTICRNSYIYQKRY